MCVRINPVILSLQFLKCIVIWHKRANLISDNIKIVSLSVAHTRLWTFTIQLLENQNTPHSSPNTAITIWQP
jgi:hypothetical protein